MANRKQGYLDKAKRQMKKKGTVGAFTEYCGGKVTDKCIERALNSNDDTLRKRAQFAKNVRAKDGGAKPLPGGIMQPIGYGAFKFHGNKHDEAGMGSDSGIILEEGGKKKPGLEVEDGELQVDVNTKDGKKEYIVSDYIKNPATGNTLAEDLEKELAKAKNNQEAAKITARYVRLNEKLRGEEGEPESVEKPREKAQLGKRRKQKKQYEQDMADYEESLSEFEEKQSAYEDEKKAVEERNKKIREENKKAKEDYEAKEAKRKEIIERNEKLRSERGAAGAIQETDPNTGERIYGETVVNSGNRADKMRDWYNRMTEEQGSLPEDVDRFDFSEYMTDGEFDPSKFDTTEAKDSFRSWYNELDDDLVTGKIASDNQGRDLIFGDQWYSRHLLERPGAPEAEPEYKPEEDLEAPTFEGERPDKPADLPNQFRPRMPGTMLQMAGPIAALQSMQAANLMKPEYAREVRMGRTNLDPERAAAAQQSQGAAAGITSSMSGPGALAMQQKNLAAGQQAQRNINDQESRANLQIANTEKGINAGIRQQNASNAMKASEYNASAKTRTAEQNRAIKLAAINQMGKIGTQTVKDYNQQYANFGSDMMQYGPVAADYYANVYKGNTPFNMGARDINVSGAGAEEQVADIMQNQQASEILPDSNDTNEGGRKGRYVKKPGKIRRKTTRKRRR